MYQNFWSSIKLADLLSKIRSFRLLNLKDMPDNQLNSKILEVLTFNGKFIMPTFIHEIPEGTAFYRVRKNIGFHLPCENLSSEPDFWNPPVKYITQPGRLNKVGESLLYTSHNDVITAINEMKLKKDDQYAVIKYVAKEKIKANCIGTSSIQQLKIPQSLTQHQIDVFNVINDFLNDEFSTDVGIGTEYRYKVSEIITKSYFDLPPNQVQDAWLYRSVQDKQKYNVCFRPERAKALLELKGAFVAKYTESGNINEIKSVIRGFDLNGHPMHYQIGSDVQKLIFPEIRGG